MPEIDRACVRCGAMLVNGYVCQTTCDVAAARKGHDPRNPHDDPVKAAQLDAARGVVKPADTKDARDAVQFGGSLGGLSAASARTVTPPAARLLDRYA